MRPHAALQIAEAGCDAGYAQQISRAQKSSETRRRILLSALTLFNEQGEAHTTTNAIADEVDISPGNLHYHFSKKSTIVSALLAEFQADMRRVLEPPDSENVFLDDFWIFLHLLLEITAAYSFLFRDPETISARYPDVRHALKCLTKGLGAAIELYIRGLVRAGVLNVSADATSTLCGNLVVILLFSATFDKIKGLSADRRDTSAARVASSAISMLLPYVSDEALPPVADLIKQYQQ